MCIVKNYFAIMTISTEKADISEVIRSVRRRKKMLSVLFTICMIWFVGKFFIFGLKASWGIMKLLCTVIFFPVILIGMVVGGLMYIAFPLLIIGGIIGLVTSHS